MAPYDCWSYGKSPSLDSNWMICVTDITSIATHPKLGPQDAFHSVTWRTDIPVPALLACLFAVLVCNVEGNECLEYFRCRRSVGNHQYVLVCIRSVAQFHNADNVR